MRAIHMTIMHSPSETLCAGLHVTHDTTHAQPTPPNRHTPHHRHRHGQCLVAPPVAPHIHVPEPVAVRRCVQCAMNSQHIGSLASCNTETHLPTRDARGGLVATDVSTTECKWSVGCSFHRSLRCTVVRNDIFTLHWAPLEWLIVVRWPLQLVAHLPTEGGVAIASTFFDECVQWSDAELTAVSTAL